MNDYERLLERVKGLNRELAMLQLTAFGQVIESTNEEEKAWNEGSASALQASKELVEKIIEESPATIHGIPDRLISPDLLEESQ